MDAIDSLADVKEKIVKDLKIKGQEEIRRIDVSELTVFDLKGGSTASVSIEATVNGFMLGISKVRFAAREMAYYLNVYRIYVNANYTIGQHKMDTIVKLLPTAYYTHTKKLQHGIGYL